MARTKLVDLLIQIAHEKDLEAIYGIVVSESTKMTELRRKMGFDIRYTP